jgi:hypothetical protein
MKFNKQQQSASVNPISELYPKTSYVKDESTGTETTTIVEHLKGLAITGFEISEYGTLGIKFTKTNSVGETRDYVYNERDFFSFNFKSEESKQKTFDVKINQLMNVFKAFGHTISDETLEKDINSLQELCDAWNEELVFPLENPDVYLKLVFKDATGNGKPKYKVSVHHPIVHKDPSKFKYKLDDYYNPDNQEYIKTASEADDDILPSNTGVDNDLL